MMSLGTRTGQRCVGAAVLAALSCARFGYEALPDAQLEPIPNDTQLNHGGGVGGGGASGSSSGGGAAASASGQGGTGSSIDAGDSAGSDGIDAGDSAGSGGIDAGASSGGTGGATLVGCEPGVATATWSFASDADGWESEADPGARGALSWTDATGEPAPGALEIDATVAGGVANVRVFVDQAPADLTTRVIYARAFLASGSGLSAKVFAQSGGSGWGDGHEVYLEGGQWYCLSLDLQDIAVNTPDFDGTAVRRVGVFFFGDASARLYVDQVTY